MRFNEFDKENLPFDVANDVKVYMLNDKNFYRKHYYPCMANMQPKIKSKDFNPVAEMYTMVKEGCSAYSEAFDIPKENFDKQFLRNLISDIMKDELPKLRKGEY